MAASLTTDAAVERVVQCLRIQTDHRLLYAEQIRSASGVNVVTRADVQEALACHPRVRVEGTQYGYVPALIGLKSSKDLLAKLREVRDGISREGGQTDRLQLSICRNLC